MFDFTDKNNIGKEYKDFVLISIDDLVDYKTKAIFLRHKHTGLEVYHILKDDKENLFSFNFRTIAKDSKGTAHIMEHSVLCGSEKYKLKEPFETLAATSINTFLNAMTSPNWTMYPGSSVVRSDYFNMLDVYADAVFFPLLDYETFIQEAHRLELNENDEFSIQGVVYNEMKGDFSSFNQVANGELIKGMYPDSFPAFCSGGEPCEIPKLTYQEFLDYHQTFYHPNNCLLFLYGNIPTSDQLDFLSERFMNRIEQKYGFSQCVENVNSKVPLINSKIRDLQKLNIHSESQTLTFSAPKTGSSGNTVCMNWYSGKTNMEKFYLSELLGGSDESPLSLKLRESGLGEDIAPFTGNFGRFEEEVFTYGLSGVKKGNEQKVFDLIEKSLKEIYENGFDEKQIESTINGIDFGLREENRYSGPYSLYICQKVINGWCIGLACDERLTPISSFEQIKKLVKFDKDYSKNLVKKYFLDKDVVIKMIVEPKDDYFEVMQKKENELINLLSKNVNKEELKIQLKKLHEYQEHIETPEELSCMPHTKLENLDTQLEKTETQIQFIKGYENCDVPLFINKEETNGNFYMDILFPYDCLEPKYLKYISILREILVSMGWGNKNWVDCLTEGGAVFGGLYGMLCETELSTSPFVQEIAKKYEQYHFCGRKMIGFTAKGLTSKINESLRILTDVILNASFTDKKRFDSLISELKSDKKSDFVNNGLNYIGRRTSCLINVLRGLGEIKDGITSLETLKEFTIENYDELLKTFEFIYKECLNSGGIIHITSDEESLKTILPLLSDFAKNTKIKSLVPSKNYSVEDLKPIIFQSEKSQGEFAKQMIQVDTQTNYAFAVHQTSGYMTKELASEEVLITWLKSHSLWDKIRLKGGAYGCGMWISNLEQLAIMYSFRDPTPHKTVQVYLDSLKEVSQMPIPKEEIEKTIVSWYGEEIIPETPQTKGFNAFLSVLNGTTQDFRQNCLNQVLQVTSEDVQNAAKRFYEFTTKMLKSGIFCNNSNVVYGNKIDFNL